MHREQQVNQVVPGDLRIWSAHELVLNLNETYCLLRRKTIFILLWAHKGEQCDNLVHGFEELLSADGLDIVGGMRVCRAYKRFLLFDLNGFLDFFKLIVQYFEVCYPIKPVHKERTSVLDILRFSDF